MRNFRFAFASMLVAGSVAMGPMSAQAAPEIMVAHGQWEILDGNSQAYKLSGALFDGVQEGGAVDHMFHIYNLGNSDLSITLPVGIDGLGASEFNIMTPPATTVSAGSNTHFVLRFSPVTVGTYVAVLTISNSDGDEGPFDFALEGRCIGDEAQHASSLGLNKGSYPEKLKCNVDSGTCSFKTKIECFNFDTIEVPSGTMYIFETLNGFVNQNTVPVVVKRFKKVKPYGGDFAVFRALKIKVKDAGAASKLVVIADPDIPETIFSDNMTMFDLF